MSLLKLKDIGKIYVSEGNVSVGIRGVNLSFDKGEFVAITGASGSGKSTLLNIISGMDTYEEGELFIENEPTSHFLQSDWEEYRKKYISFIFQEYNIIDSYTVLQNVELSLMHIENKKERRRRAVELLNRVGMGSHLKHKGSKLSGGQKQRTVIARALAKDSPIILADEPTGNLDFATSTEIIALMKEVAKDKLLIMVTHNFDQVENYATRHIRIFDGAVESDQILIPSTPEEKKPEEKIPDPPKKKKFSDIRNGITLGVAIFKATPKLSLFMCLLMLVGTLGLFFATAFFGDFTAMFKPNYMFNNIDGRVVLVKRDGQVISENELEQIKADYGALSYIHYDFLLDRTSSSNSGYNVRGMINITRDGKEPMYIDTEYTFGEKINADIGRQPEKVNELLLSLPISFQTTFGKKEIEITNVKIDGMEYKIVGIHYFADNNRAPKALLTESGFKFMSVYNRAFVSDNLSNSDFFLNFYASASALHEDGIYKDDYRNENISGNIRVSFDENVVKSGRISVNDSKYLSYLQEFGDKKDKIVPTLSLSYNYYVYSGYGDRVQSTFQKTIPNNIIDFKEDSTAGSVVFSPDALIAIMEEYMSVSYIQASVFFENNAKAEEAATALNNAGYIAVPADTTYERDPLTAITQTLESILSLVVWGLAIIFLAFFINLCSLRMLTAFKGDMAIMRSMGITVRIIKTGMYTRMIFSLIPAFILLIICPILIYTSPVMNGYFTYLYAYQYALITVGMILLTIRVTHKQIRKLFTESVKKSLKGGNDR